MGEERHAGCAYTFEDDEGARPSNRANADFSHRHSMKHNWVHDLTNKYDVSRQSVVQVGHSDAEAYLNTGVLHERARPRRTYNLLSTI